MSADYLADRDYLPNTLTPEGWDPDDPETWELADEN